MLSPVGRWWVDWPHHGLSSPIYPLSTHLDTTIFGRTAALMSFNQVVCTTVATNLAQPHLEAGLVTKGVNPWWEPSLFSPSLHFGRVFLTVIYLKNSIALLPKILIKQIRNKTEKPSSWLKRCAWQPWLTLWSLLIKLRGVSKFFPMLNSSSSIHTIIHIMYINSCLWTKIFNTVDIG